MVEKAAPHPERKERYPRFIYTFASGVTIANLNDKEWKIIDELPLHRTEGVTSLELGKRISSHGSSEPQMRRNATSAISDAFQKKLKEQGFYIAIGTKVVEKRQIHTYSLISLDDTSLSEQIPLFGKVVEVKSIQEKILIERLKHVSWRYPANHTALINEMFRTEMASGMSIIDVDERFDAVLRRVRKIAAGIDHEVKVGIPGKQEGLDLYGLLYWFSPKRREE